jgi:hypothetical protein
MAAAVLPLDQSPENADRLAITFSIYAYSDDRFVCERPKTAAGRLPRFAGSGMLIMVCRIIETHVANPCSDQARMSGD